jgi:hypothetical protein
MRSLFPLRVGLTARQVYTRTPGIVSETEPKKAAEMFAEDGAFEMPYLATFGFPSQYKGRDAIAGFFQFVRDLYPGLQFGNIKVLMDTPDQDLAGV